MAGDSSSGQASAGLSPKPFMIKSPMVITRSGTTTTGAAGVAGVAAGTGVGFDIAAPPEAAVAVECADGAVDSDDAERRVVVDRAVAVEVNTVTVRKEPRAMAATSPIRAVTAVRFIGVLPVVDTEEKTGDPA